jgi:hypothetical protein
VDGSDGGQNLKRLQKPSVAGRPAAARGKSGPPPVRIAPGKIQPFKLAIHLHTHTSLAKQQFQISNRNANS